MAQKGKTYKMRPTRLRLLGNVVTATVHPIDTANTVTDAFGRRVLKEDAYKPAITIKGQIDFAVDRDRLQSLMGADVQSRTMNAIVRKRDADKKGWTPTSGDRISNITSKNGYSKDVEFYVENPRPHIEWEGGFQAWLMELEDRGPIRNVEE